MTGTARTKTRRSLMALAAAAIAATAVALSPGIGAGQTEEPADPPVESQAPPETPLGTEHKGHDDGVQSAVLSNTTISSAGPLTNIFLSNQGNCQVDHVGDTDHEFFPPSDPPGACATLIATGGTLYGPSQIPAGGSASPRTTFIEVSQSAVTGTGTAADPLKVITVMDAGAILRLTQTDSYVIGEEQYRTDVVVTNLVPTGAAVNFVLYRAGDCFLQNSDFGFGDLLPNGDVGCRGSDDNGATVNNRIERWIPITAGSSAFEEDFNAVWDWIGTQAPFPNTCICTTYVDNGAGLSWTGSLGPSASATYSHYTVFDPNFGVIEVEPTFTG